MALPMLAALGTTAVTVYMGLKAAREKGEISEQEYQESVRAINKLEQELKSLRPDETWENIDPQLLQKAAEYSPDIAAFVEENAPQLITEAGAAAERRIQRQALQKYAAQAETGRDVIADAQREQAIFESGTRAKQRQQALMQKMKQQGMLGSGAELAAQLQIEQAEAQAAREQSLRGVQEAEMRRRQALGEAAQLAGQMRSQALNVESANVSTMNAYNQRLANAKNLYNRYASGARNEAQLENQRREIARQSANIQLANEYAKFNRQQQEAARERARQYDVDVAKTIFGKRQGAESGKYDAKRQGIADRTTAWTSGISTGLQTAAIGSKFLGGPSSLTSSDTGGFSDIDYDTEGYTGPMSRTPMLEMEEPMDVMGNAMQGIPQPIDETPEYIGPYRPRTAEVYPRRSLATDERILPIRLGR